MYTNTHTRLTHMYCTYTAHKLHTNVKIYFVYTVYTTYAYSVYTFSDAYTCTINFCFIIFILETAILMNF